MSICCRLSQRNKQFDCFGCFGSSHSIGVLSTRPANARDCLFHQKGGMLPKCYQLPPTSATWQHKA